jgi:hypothetical protein
VETGTVENAALTNTPPAHIAEVVRSAEEQLTGLLLRRAEIMRRIGTVKQMLAGMADLFGNSILNDELLCALDRGAASRRKGFTNACRQILLESKTPLRARHAEAELRKRFPELAGHHKDLAASVTTVFHRLAVYGEARCSVDDHGVKVWEWATDRRSDEKEALNF